VEAPSIKRFWSAPVKRLVWLLDRQVVDGSLRASLYALQVARRGNFEPHVWTFTDLATTFGPDPAHHAFRARSPAHTCCLSE
jgi:hypothetical protein